jgi:cation diffusion facilitator CzcD-associated flavoprotein CzcO
MADSGRRAVISVSPGRGQPASPARERSKDRRETPIERITKRGIKTTDRYFDLDIIAYATGFDAITGSYGRTDIRGVGGASSSTSGRTPEPFLGLAIHGYANYLMLGGPQSNSASTNIRRFLQNADHLELQTRLFREAALESSGPATRIVAAVRLRWYRLPP